MTNIRFYSKEDNQTTHALLTPWSFLHLLSGIVFTIISLSLYQTFSTVSLLITGLMIHTIYELKDYYYSHIAISRMKQLPHSIETQFNQFANDYAISKYGKSLFDYNSIWNGIGDTLVFIIGMILAFVFMTHYPQQITISMIILLCSFYTFILYINFTKYID